jgi:hypothetical protein
MAYCGNLYNCDNTFAQDYVPGTCGEFFLGGISAVLLLRCDVNIADPSNATEVQALIEGNDARLILGVQIGMAAPSPVSVTSFISCVPDIPVTYDRTFDLADRNVTAENVLFYNSINAASGWTNGGALLYQCDADRVLYINSPLRIQGGIITPNQNNEMQRWEGTGAWRSSSDPLIYDAPPGIFGA